MLGEMYFALAKQKVESHWQPIVIGAAIGSISLLLLRAHLFAPHFMFGGDGVTNLLPALHARASIVSGELPIYTELWYNGAFQPVNPLWKGFYPLWWPLFIPWVPLLSGLKVVIAVHYIAVPVIAYWFACHDLRKQYAIPFAALWLMPMVWFAGAYEKTLSWPWITLSVMQLTSGRIQTRRGGFLAGVGIGVALLTGSIYYAFYASVLIGCVALAVKSKDFIFGASVGGLVATPKLLFSIAPVLLRESHRPPVSLELTARELIASLFGLWFSVQQGFYVPLSARQGGWAAIGVPAVMIACGYFIYSYVTEGADLRWVVGLAAAALIGTLLATGWAPIYQIPGVEIFRTASRASILVALSLLLAIYAASKAVVQSDIDALRILVSLLLISSAIGGFYAWSLVDRGDGEVIEPGERVADSVSTSGCTDTWIEIGYNGSATPYDKVISYSLTQRGFEASATAYGQIGQQYNTHKEGELTFDILIISTPLPEDKKVKLTGGWGGPVRGEIDTAEFSHYDTVHTDRGPVYIYKYNKSDC